jgi:hypothetical protein
MTNYRSEYGEFVDPMLTAQEVGEWINEEPHTVIEWGNHGTNLFPRSHEKLDGTQLWNRSHIQQWLEYKEVLDVGLIQPPQAEARQAPNAPQHESELGGGETQLIEEEDGDHGCHCVGRRGNRPTDHGEDGHDRAEHGSSINHGTGSDGLAD